MKKDTARIPTAFDVKFVNEAGEVEPSEEVGRQRFSLKRMQLKVRQEKIWHKILHMNP